MDSIMAGYAAFFAPTLGLNEIRTETDLAKAVERRLPARTIRKVQQAGIAPDELYKIVAPRRTLARRKDALSVGESDRLARVVRVLAHAIAVHGDSARALAWLRRPMQRFDGRPPLQLVETEAGARRVEELLGQIDHGMAA